ncbi:hypothetical protein [uncultured Tolumonas sp.]|uniref:hypothetical protein n=1 Tax=uncultured Tolumonas sp. TaxID=263765 RepID=UPI002A0A6CB3|nr:hypothetical protein [uncultured Tolumonas sp.]
MAFIDIIQTAFDKDTVGMILILVSTILGLISLFAQYYHRKKINSELDLIESRVRSRRENLKNLPESDRITIEQELSAIEMKIAELRPQKYFKNRQNGSVTQELLLHIVPVVIALSFTFTLIYLLIINQNNQNYQSPEVLKNGLSIIIGYYFGVAAKEVPSGSTKNEVLSEVNNKISQIEEKMQQNKN